MASPRPSKKLELVSIIVPVLNEELGLSAFWMRLESVLKPIKEYKFEVLFIDDGSSDNSLGVLREIAALSKGINVRIISLSRNFGHQAALVCGLEKSSGAAVLTIDADLQDPPELIPLMLNEWREGSDIVLAQRQSRDGETLFKKISASWFYRFLSSISEYKIPEDVADFRLMSRRSVAALLELEDYEPYLRGMVSFIGFRQTIVHYDREARLAGSSSYKMTDMFKLARNGIVGFSGKPLKFATFLGSLVLFLTFLYSGYIVISKIMNPASALPGYTSLMVVLLVSFGVQMLTLGIIGNYLYRTLSQTRNRPRYIIAEE